MKSESKGVEITSKLLLKNKTMNQSRNNLCESYGKGGYDFTSDTFRIIQPKQSVCEDHSRGIISI